MVRDHPAGYRLGANRPPEFQKQHEADAMVGTLPKAFELQGLRRLKEALVGSGAKYGKPSIIPAEDWLADLEARIAGLERDLGLDSRPGE